MFYYRSDAARFTIVFVKYSLILILTQQNIINFDLLLDSCDHGWLVVLFKKKTYRLIKEFFLNMPFIYFGFINSDSK